MFSTYIRLSIKREQGTPPGKMSNFLHEDMKVGMQIEVSPPFGNFYLNLDDTTPVVLISGGVGLTPLTSMLEAMIQQGRKRKVPIS